jgi:NitT/TauT family transport system substrate-binding protein
MRTLRRGIFLLFGAALLAASAATAEAQPTTAPLEFNYGVPGGAHYPVYVAADLGLFAKVGLKPKFFRFQSGAPLLAGLKSDSLDVVTTGLATVFALGQDIKLKLLFWSWNDATGEGLVVDPKSGIKSYSDLAKAKRIGGASGTCAQIGLYLIAQKAHIPFDRRDVINIPAQLYHNAFMSGSIDAGIAWAPFATQLQSQGYPVVDWDEDYTEPGGVCPTLTAIRPAFLKAHPEIGLKLVEVEAMADAAIRRDPELAIDALMKQLSLSKPVATAVFARIRRKPTFAQELDPNSPYSMTAKTGGLAGKLFLAGQVFFATHAIPKPLPMSTIEDAVDPTYVEQYVAAHPK